MDIGEMIGAFFLTYGGVVILIAIIVLFFKLLIINWLADLVGKAVAQRTSEAFQEKINLQLQLQLQIAKSLEELVELQKQQEKPILETNTIQKEILEQIDYKPTYEVEDIVEEPIIQEPTIAEPRQRKTLKEVLNTKLF